MSKKDKKKKKIPDDRTFTIRLAADVVLKEYEQIREFYNKRDDYRGNLVYIMIALLAGSLVALEFIIQAELHFSYLVLAIIFSALGMLYLFQSKLATYLILYEHCILKKKINDLVNLANTKSELKVEMELLSWQKYYRDLTIKNKKLDGAFNLLSFVFAGSLPALSSVGMLIIFLSNKCAKSLSFIEYFLGIFKGNFTETITEQILLILAILFLVALLLMSLQTSITQYWLWKRVD